MADPLRAKYQICPPRNKYKRLLITRISTVSMTSAQSHLLIERSPVGLVALREQLNIMLGLPKHI